VREKRNFPPIYIHREREWGRRENLLHIIKGVHIIGKRGDFLVTFFMFLNLFSSLDR